MSLSGASESAMFFGQHPLPLDEKRRLALPATFRPLLAQGAFVFQGFERNLVVFPQATFEEICRQIGALSITDPAARLLLRLTLGTAVALTMDSDSRISLPADLCLFAGLEREVVLVGQGKYFEIWAPALWNAQKLRLQDAEANAGRFATLHLTVA